MTSFPSNLPKVFFFFKFSIIADGRDDKMPIAIKILYNLA